MKKGVPDVLGYTVLPHGPRFDRIGDPTGQGRLRALDQGYAGVRIVLRLDSPAGGDRFRKRLRGAAGRGREQCDGGGLGRAEPKRTPSVSGVRRRASRNLRGQIVFVTCSHLAPSALAGSERLAPANIRAAPTPSQKYTG